MTTSLHIQKRKLQNLNAHHSHYNGLEETLLQFALSFIPLIELTEVQFLFNGRELDDESTVEECNLQEDSCVNVTFVRNEGQFSTQQRSRPAMRNQQYYRAMQNREVEQDMFDYCIQCVTPGMLMVLIGWLLLIVIFVRVLLPDYFNTGADIFITILLLLYMVSLIKVFILSR